MHMLVRISYRHVCKKYHIIFIIFLQVNFISVLSPILLYRRNVNSVKFR